MIIVTDPKGARFAVSGDVLSIDKPRSTWNKFFGQELEATPLEPVPLASETLSELGKNPAKDASCPSSSAYPEMTSLHSGGCG